MSLSKEQEALIFYATGHLASGQYYPDDPNAAASAELAWEIFEGLLHDAWAKGHLTRWRRGPDTCTCHAYNSSECGCGEYGNGVLLSLDENPYERGIR